MNNDILKEKLNEIKSWCESNNVCIFEGIIEREDFKLIEWSVKKDTDWQKFIQIAQKNNINTIIIAEVFYESEDFDYDFEIYNKLNESYPELIDTTQINDETLKEINSSLKELENHKNQLLYYGLYWIILCKHFQEWLRTKAYI